MRVTPPATAQGVFMTTYDSLIDYSIRLRRRLVEGNGGIRAFDGYTTSLIRGVAVACAFQGHVHRDIGDRELVALIAG